MSDQTSTLRPRFDILQRAAGAGQADARPEPGLIEQLISAAKLDQDSSNEAIQGRRAAGYEEIMVALEERGHRRADYERDYGSAMEEAGLPGFLTPIKAGGLDFERIWQAAQAEGLEGLPATREEYERWLLNRQGEAAKDMDVVSRGEGADAWLAQFTGGTAAGMAESNLGPFQFIFGLGGKTIAQAALREGFVGLADEAINIPDRMANMRQLGRPYSARDAAIDVLGAGGGSALLAGGGQALGRYVLSPAAERFRQFYANRATTPREQAALDVLERESELDDASPFVRNAAGDAEFRDRLEETAEALAEGRAVPDQRPIRVTGAPADVALHLRGQGFSDQVVAGFLGNFEVEGGYGGALGDGGSASGIAQWRHERRQNFRDMFGKDPHEASAAEQAQFVVWEMNNPQRAGMTVAQRDAILNARTAGEAAELIDQYYERSSGEHRQRRVEAANAVFGGDIVARGSGEGMEEAAGTAAVEAARIDQKRVERELPGILRPLVDDRSVSLNNHAQLAEQLGVEEAQVQRALDELVFQGELTRTKAGIYRRATREGPEDALRFVASRGGIHPTGLGERARASGNYRGDRLQDSALNYFVPRRGPLLREGGRGVDEVGEALWDAGYFGPVETTPRPSEAEVIAFLEDSIRKGEKRYSFTDNVAQPDAPKGRRGRFQSDEHENFERGRWNAAGQRMFGRDLTDEELFAAMDLEFQQPEWRMLDGADEDEALEAVLAEMTNRQLDEALESAYLELEDEFYDAVEWQFRNAAGREGEAGTARGEGSAPDSGSARAGEERSGARSGDPRPDQLGPAPDPDNPAMRGFEEADGEAVRAQAESDWHDIRNQMEDPAVRARLRELARLQAEAPLRGENATGQAQDGTMGTPLFDAADQPLFDLGDGAGPRTISDIEAEIAADKQAVDVLRNCMI